MPGANGKKFAVAHVTGLQDLERQIYIDLFEAINAQYPKPHRQLNAMALEDMYHQNHITSSKACFGRDDLLCNMMDLLGKIFPKIDIRILNTSIFIFVSEDY